jgi:hypothetical protein
MFFYAIFRLIIEVAFIVVALVDIMTDKVIVDSYFKVVQILVSILAISTTNFPSITNTNYPSITKTTYFILAMVILNNPSITNTAYSACATLVAVILNPSSFSVNQTIPCVLIKVWVSFFCYHNLRDVYVLVLVDPSITNATYSAYALLVVNPSITNTAYSTYAILVLVIPNPSSSVNRAIP